MSAAEHEVQPEISLEMPGADDLANHDAPDRTGSVTESLQTKNWTWGILRRGDCHCYEASLTLFSDGLAHFTAYTVTSDEGDVWLFQNIRLLGPYNNELYRIGQFNGPRMAVENYRYFVLRDRWTSPLVFPQQLFPVISSVTMASHC